MIAYSNITNITKFTFLTHCGLNNAMKFAPQGPTDKKYVFR